MITRSLLSCSPPVQNWPPSLAAPVADHNQDPGQAAAARTVVQPEVARTPTDSRTGARTVVQEGRTEPDSRTGPRTVVQEARKVPDYRAGPRTVVAEAGRIVLVEAVHILPLLEDQIGLAARGAPCHKGPGYACFVPGTLEGWGAPALDCYHGLLGRSEHPRHRGFL